MKTKGSGFGVSKGSKVENPFSTDAVEIEKPISDVTDALGLQGQTASQATENAKMEAGVTITGLQGTFMETILAIIRICEGIDPYIATHQRRVAQLAHAIAEEMNLGDEHIKWVDIAAMLHDISKISSARSTQSIVSNPARLKSSELTLIKFHPQIAYDILKQINFLGPVAEIVLQHNEKIDGSGYPRGLTEGAIMLEARILAVADVVEAMCSNRSYRSSLGVERALEEVSRNKGTLYDSEVVGVCLRLFNEKGFIFN